MGIWVQRDAKGGDRAGFSNDGLVVANDKVRSKPATALRWVVEGRDVASLVRRAPASLIVCLKGPLGAFSCSHLSICLSGAARRSRAAFSLCLPSVQVKELLLRWPCHIPGAASAVSAFDDEAL